jgi:HEAT repeat protein
MIRPADDSVQAAAIHALAGRDGPEVTAALLDRLAHDDESLVRSTAEYALAGRDGPEVTAALLDRRPPPEDVAEV